MMRRLPALVLAAAVLAAGPSAADPSMECSVTETTQVATGDCLAAAEKTVDAALDQALGFAVDAAKALDAETGRAAAVPALDAGQKAWSAYRDAHCAYVGETFGGGSGTGIAIRSCRIELARARTDVLMRFAG
jgi:uncharacterized protein YecT (DUF1311 family)